MKFNRIDIRNYIFGGLIAILPVTPCFAVNAVQSTNMPMNKILPQFISYAEHAQKDWQIPGMAIAIVKDDKIIYAQGFGKRDTSGAPVNQNTIFDIASLTKSFTATLLAIQIDQGKYTWNTKVTTLYPQFKLYDPNATNAFEVQDLLAHDSGLPEDALETLMGDFGYSLDHAIYVLRFIKPVAPFRTEFAYEDIFPMLAGTIIAKLSGRSFTDGLHHYLFDPLHMNRSYGDEEKVYQLNNVAQPFAQFAGQNYAYPKNPSYSSRLRASVKEPGSSGGIHSSATDMAKWLIFNINNGVVGNSQLVSTKNMNFIHSPQMLIKTSSRNVNLSGSTEQAYGIGWFIDKQEYQPYSVLYHPGGGMGMHALMAYVPQAKIGIVILTNTWGNKVPEALYRRFFDLYFDKKPLKDWNKIFLQEKANAAANDKALTKSDPCESIRGADLKKYIGTYYNPVYGNLVISKHSDHLLLNIGPIGIKWDLTYCKQNTLKAYWPNPYGMNLPMLSSGQDLVMFTTGANNVVQKMTIPFLNDDGGGGVFVKK